MTPSREMVNKKRLNSELEIIKQMVPVSCQETVKVCELYLSASEKINEDEIRKIMRSYREVEWMFVNDKDDTDEKLERLLNQNVKAIIDLCTPLVMRLQGRVEELEVKIIGLEGQVAGYRAVNKDNDYNNLKESK